MRLPLSAADDSPMIPNEQDAYIENPHAGKRYLTPLEALDVINQLSAMMMADRRYRYGGRKTG
jgi:hypothetical protein